MRIECDVLVVGAGPAGSSAARSSALNGAKTADIHNIQIEDLNLY